MESAHLDEQRVNMVTRRFLCSRFSLVPCLFGGCLFLILFQNYDLTDRMFRDEQGSAASLISLSPRSNSSSIQARHCALLFFGVPRLFRNVVLPSIQKYILEANPDCDVFVHTCNITTLSVLRNNEQNGTLIPTDVYGLNPNAAMIENMESFYAQRNLSYFRKHHYLGWGPCCGSTDNMVKQWHSIDGAWKLMEQYAQQENLGDGENYYSRVGLFRSDVFYTHPIYVVSNSTSEQRQKEEEAVVPRFLWKKFGPSPYLVNDRMFYGTYQNAKVWATGRFDYVPKFVAAIENRTDLQGIHSETFMRWLIGNMASLQKKDICFWLVRTTGLIDTSDCENNESKLNTEQNKEMISKGMDCCWDCIDGYYNCTEKQEH